MSVLWSPRAQANLRSILTYIAKDDPEAARKLVAQIIQSVEGTLADSPKAGRPGRVEGTREWIAHKRYIVVYRVSSAGQVQVATVRHTSTRWPRVI
jgi:toxin ParE1/3/4